MKRDRELWRFSRLRQVKYLNNIVEQDHRRIKRLVRPGLGFGSLPTARRTLAGYEGMAMIRRGRFGTWAGATCALRPPLLPACSGSRLDLGLATALSQPAPNFATEPAGEADVIYDAAPYGNAVGGARSKALELLH